MSRVFHACVFGSVLLSTVLSAMGAASDRDRNKLPDRWERKYFRKLGNKASADPDRDGLSNLKEVRSQTHPRRADTDRDGVVDGEEVRRGLSPLRQDTDSDGLSDGYEVAHGLSGTSSDTDQDTLPDKYEVDHGLNPIDGQDAWEDTDGDRVPNIFEYANHSNPANSQSVPAPHFVIDAAQVVETSTQKRTIQAALDALSGVGQNPDRYAILSVRSGTYQETLRMDVRRVLLLGELGPIPAKLLGNGSKPIVHVSSGFCILDGFEIDGGRRNGIYWTDGGAALVGTSNTAADARMVNCDVYGFESTAEQGVLSVHSGSLQLCHTTVRDNHVSDSKGVMAVGARGRVAIRNSIIWNSESKHQIVVEAGASVGVVSSFILGGEFGGNPQDPMLDRYGFLEKASPAIRAVPRLPGVVWDLGGQVRGGQTDCGAYQADDRDADGIPDLWELRNNGHLLGVPDTDDDGDGLSNYYEYLLGFEPNNPSTFGSRTRDFERALTAIDDPWLPEDWRLDTDGDGMTDAYEVQYGLQPTNPRDALEDADKDRIPNVYEFGNGTNPWDAASAPEPHFVVDGAAVEETRTLKRTLSSAIGNLVSSEQAPHAYPILFVKGGDYREAISIVDQRALVLGELGSTPPRLLLVNFSRNDVRNRAIQIFHKDTVLDGFAIEDGFDAGSSALTTALFVSMPSSDDQARLLNCIVRNSRIANAAVEIERGELSVVHTTFANNQAWATSPTGVLSIRRNGSLYLKNSVVWNPEFGTNKQVRSSYGDVHVFSSIVYGGEFQAIHADPKFDRYGYPLAGSSVIGIGASTASTAQDLSGELRGVRIDSGAYQFTDIDADGLPDAWERGFFKNLDAVPQDDFDADGLINVEEHALGLDPTNSDTHASGQGDLTEAERDLSNPWLPPEWKVDTDKDGMPDRYERKQGFDPSDYRDALEDSDRDRVPNVFEFANGSDPHDARSLPLPHYIVDPMRVFDTDREKATLEEAVLAAYEQSSDPYRYSILYVKSGQYGTWVHGDGGMDCPRLLILGELGDVPPKLLVGENTRHTLRFRKGPFVLDGFVIEPEPNLPMEFVRSEVIQVDMMDAQGQVRFINCDIHDFPISGSLVEVTWGEATFAHCTLRKNQCTSSLAQLVSVKEKGQLQLRNSILWNPAIPVAQQVVVQSKLANPASAVVLAKTILFGGAYGGMDLDPMLDKDGRLMPGSPAIDVGDRLLVSGEDLYGEDREDGLSDLGTHEYRDFDADGLPDWWERFWFQDLTASDQDDPDQDKLVNTYEYLFGFSPLDSDTVGRGRGDLREAALGDGKKFASDWNEDGDQDGLSTGFERGYGIDPGNADSNGDGIFDGLSVGLGIDPAAVDSDQDGLNNREERQLGTNPLVQDSDGDGVVDGQDAFPQDPAEHQLAHTAGDREPPRVTIVAPAGAVQTR